MLTHFIAKQTNAAIGLETAARLPISRSITFYVVVVQCPIHKKAVIYQIGWIIHILLWNHTKDESLTRKMQMRCHARKTNA